MTIVEFIERILIQEFKNIHQGEAHHYICFSLICQGIDFLGACLDSEPFSAKGLGDARFRRAIHDLFPIPYRKFNQGSGKPFDLYENLCCSLLHTILPGSPIELVRRSDEETLNPAHLAIKEIRGMNRLVLVLEDLFDDYEKACKEIIARITKGRLKGWKFAGDFLSTQPRKWFSKMKQP